VVLRLHLKGLSDYRASNGKVRLDAAVSIQEGKAQVRMWKDGKEDVPLDEKSPLWQPSGVVRTVLSAARTVFGVRSGVKMFIIVSFLARLVLQSSFSVNCR
jgi:hypothetical protein